MVWSNTGRKLITSNRIEDRKKSMDLGRVPVVYYEGTLGAMKITEEDPRCSRGSNVSRVSFRIATGADLREIPGQRAHKNGA